jgi:hypothetical protein
MGWVVVATDQVQVGVYHPWHHHPTIKIVDNVSIMTASLWARVLDTAAYHHFALFDHAPQSIDDLATAKQSRFHISLLVYGFLERKDIARIVLACLGLVIRG